MTAATETQDTGHLPKSGMTSTVQVLGNMIEGFDIESNRTHEQTID